MSSITGNSDNIFVNNANLKIVKPGKGIIFADGSVFSTAPPNSDSGNTAYFSNGINAFVITETTANTGFAGNTAPTDAISVSSNLFISYTGNLITFGQITAGSVANVESNILTLEVSNGLIWSNITTLQTDLSTVNSNLNTEITSNITTLQTDLSTVNSNLNTEITSNITTLQTKTTDITHSGSTTTINGNVVVGSQLTIAEYATDSIAIGRTAGLLSQNNQAVAIGQYCGVSQQGLRSVAVGPYAGQQQQANDATSIGYLAGRVAQGSDAVAIGRDAAVSNQDIRAVAIGAYAGGSGQNVHCVSIGYTAGRSGQQQDAVAIGVSAGNNGQGSKSIAIGAYAAQTSQHSSTIMLNASGVVQNTDGVDRFYVRPIRPSSSPQGALEYNNTTKEVTYDTGNTSDDRLKHNEVEVSNVLSSIDQLRFLTYDKTFEMLAADFNGDLGDLEHYKDAGFIAQEVVEIPEFAWLVGGGGSYEELVKNPVTEEVVDEETGEVTVIETVPGEYETIEIPYSINYRCLANYSIQGVKELHALVKAQQEQITTLTARIEALENN